MRKQIAIIGGGYVGIELAHALQDKADVTLIEENSHFVHAVATIRAWVQPALLDRVLTPYDKLLTRGTLVTARAASVDTAGVTLVGGRRIAADYIVVATGSGNGPAFKPSSDGIAGLRAAHTRIHALIAAAQTIAIVGAGPVGTELAGEIAHAMPGKKLVLISADATLFPMMPAKMGADLLAKLRAAGVQVVLGSKVQNLQSLTEPYAGTLQLSDGSQITADLIIPAIGSRANTDLLAALPGAVKTTANRVKADGWMRPSSLPNVFAAGDAVDLGDAMTVVATARQIPWLKATFGALIAGKSLDSVKPYAPWTKGKTPLLVPLGPDKGASFLIMFTTGNFLTRLIKGKSLFIERYRKLLRQA